MPKNLNYPLASFQKAYELANAVDALGGNCTVENATQKMQRKVSGGFMVIISSAQKFGLVNFKKGMITISEEYKLIKHAYTNSEKIGLLRKAFLKPQVFNTLYDRFKGRELPIEMLDKILIREFGVEENTAGRVAGYFVEGLKTYSLLNASNVVENDQETISERIVAELPKEKVTKTAQQTSLPKIDKEVADASFIAKKTEQYEVQLSGPGINSKISIKDEDDLLILEAMLTKIRNGLRVGKTDDQTK